MLKKYDKRAIPSEYGEPVNVSVQILVAGFTTVARLGTTVSFVVLALSGAYHCYFFIYL